MVLSPNKSKSRHKVALKSYSTPCDLKCETISDLIWRFVFIKQNICISTKERAFELRNKLGLNCEDKPL